MRLLAYGRVFMPLNKFLILPQFSLFITTMACGSALCHFLVNEALSAFEVRSKVWGVLLFWLLSCPVVPPCWTDVISPEMSGLT